MMEEEDVHHNSNRSCDNITTTTTMTTTRETVVAAAAAARGCIIVRFQKELRLFSLEIPEVDATGYRNLVQPNPNLGRSDATKYGSLEIQLLVESNQNNHEVWEGES
jgi:hypothetical protein